MRLSVYITHICIYIYIHIASALPTRALPPGFQAPHPVQSWAPCPVAGDDNVNVPKTVDVGMLDLVLVPINSVSNLESVQNLCGINQFEFQLLVLVIS